MNISGSIHTGVVVCSFLNLSVKRFVFYLAFFSALLMPQIIDGEDARIVSLSPAVTELIFQLGQGHLLVGRSEVCNYPEKVREIPALGRYGDPSIERVLETRPTLFLTNALRSPQVGDVLKKLGVKVIVKQCATVAEYREWVELLGKELGCIAEAREELRRFDSEIEKLCSLEKLPVSLLWVISETPLMTGGRNSLLSEVSRLAGMNNLGDVSTYSYFRLSRDFLFRSQPDVLVWANSGAIPNKNNLFWKNLKAVKQGRVLCFLHEDTVMRPGPRLPAGVRKLRREVKRMMRMSL